MEGRRNHHGDFRRHHHNHRHLRPHQPYNNDFNIYDDRPPPFYDHYHHPPPPPPPPPQDSDALFYGGYDGSMGMASSSTWRQVPVEDDIRAVFEPYGYVIEVVTLRNKKTGMQQGSCFVKYATVEEAD